MLQLAVLHTLVEATGGLAKCAVAVDLLWCLRSGALPRTPFCTLTSMVGLTIEAHIVVGYINEYALRV